jgi:urease accessory protein
MFKYRVLVVSFVMMPVAAHAHTRVGGTASITHGLLHPFGIDHLLAMVTVGLLGAFLSKTTNGRALWLLPASFVSLMGLGAALGMTGAELPYVEVGIALSVLVFGIAVALQLELPILAATGLVGVFALFHGHAHGTEMPASLGATGYGFGFLLATICLHAVGISIGLAILRVQPERSTWLWRIGGSGIAVIGATLLKG